MDAAFQFVGLTHGSKFHVENRECQSEMKFESTFRN